MNGSSGYRRLYFHRPIWTPENQRLWGILFTVTLVVLSTLLLSMRWSARISAERTTAQIKSQYISFLLQANFPMKPASSSAATAMPSSPAAKPDQAGLKTMVTEGIKSSTEKSISAGNNSASAGEGDDLAASFGLGIIASAVESVPGYPGLTYRSSRSAKPLTLQNEVKVFRSHGEQIQIPVPEVFRFASENGNRDLHETSAVMEMNEIDVKYCFERFNRFDPSFSGYLLLRFTIHPDGYVIPASIKFLKTDIRDPRILDCIRKQLQRWRNFTPIALEDGNFTVTRKYVF